MAQFFKLELDYLLSKYIQRLDAVDTDYQDRNDYEEVMVRADKEEVLYFVRYSIMRYEVGLGSEEFDIATASAIISNARKKLQGFRTRYFSLIASYKVTSALGSELFDMVEAVRVMWRR